LGKGCNRNLVNMGNGSQKVPVASDTENGTRKIDVHVDIPREQFEELRAGRKILVIKDTTSGNKLSVGNEPNRITWKQAGAVISILLAIGAQMVLFGRKMQELDDSIGNVSNLENDVSTSLTLLSQHGKEFSVLRDDMNKMLGLYTQVMVELNDRTKDRYFSSEALKDWRSHEKEHHAEEKVLAAELNSIRRLLERRNAQNQKQN